jgi:hypothetical protein
MFVQHPDPRNTTISIQADTSHQHIDPLNPTKQTLVVENVKASDDEPEPIDCDTIGRTPIQSIAPTKDSEDVDLESLDPSTGKYTMIYSVSEVYNGCDISPNMAWAYCSDRLGVLARFDENKIRFVARLPKGTFAAAFGSSSDTLYFTIWDSVAKTSDIYSLSGVDSLTGYADKDDTGIADFTGLSPIAKGVAAMIGDLVAITADFEGNGVSEYLMGVLGSHLYLISVNNAQVWKLKHNAEGWMFGAGWHFQNNAYFAENLGKGVVWVDPSSVNIAEETVSLVKVGSSDATDQNDGLNCHGAAPPDSWEFATPSPTAPVGGHGDPHMVNILGEQFNIWRLGEAELLKIPRNSSASTAGLRFLADVTEGGKGSGACARPPYMTAMRLSGNWFGTRELFVQMVDGEMRVLLGSKNLNPSLERLRVTDNLIVTRPSEARVTIEVGNATIEVMHGGHRDIHGQFYFLNMEARNLGSLGLEIGGILGLDDHTVVEEKPAHCKHEWLAAERHGSRLLASLQD